MRRCGSCGESNADDGVYCRACGEPLGAPVQEPASGEAAAPEKVPRLAVILSILWGRKGPMLMALSLVLMMSMIFVPWLSVRIDVFGLQLYSQQFSGWALFIPRFLMYLAALPLLFSLLMIAGIGTRRRVIETHVCAFLGGIVFTLWGVLFGTTLGTDIATESIPIVRDVLYMDRGKAVTLVIIFFVIFMVGLGITVFDRGRQLREAGKIADDAIYVDTR